MKKKNIIELKRFDGAGVFHNLIIDEEPNNSISKIPIFADIINLEPSLLAHLYNNDNVMFFHHWNLHSILTFNSVILVHVYMYVIWLAHNLHGCDMKILKYIFSLSMKHQDTNVIRL